MGTQMNGGRSPKDLRARRPESESETESERETEVQNE
jgi:hypothetical protein